MTKPRTVVSPTAIATIVRPGRVVLALVVCWLLIGKTATAGDLDQKIHAERYGREVVPFLRNHCVDCHGPQLQEAGLRLDALNGDLVNGPDRPTWAKVRTRLIAGEMPPQDEPRPSGTALGAVVDWIGAGLIEAARGPHRKSEPAPPSEGNRVDHDLLFGSHASTIIAASPARQWRVSPHIYFKFLQDLDPDVSSFYGEPDYRIKGAIKRFVVRYSQPFSVPATGFSDYSGTLAIDKPTAEVLIRNAKHLATCQTQWRVDKERQPVRDRRTGLLALQYKTGIPQEFLVLMDTGVPPTPETMQAAIRKQFELVLLRQPSEVERSRFLTLMEKNIQDSGQVEGVRGALAAVILLRETIFRSFPVRGICDGATIASSRDGGRWWPSSRQT